MKYFNLLILIFLLATFSVFFANGIGQHIKLSDECDKYKEKLEAELFITESFKKTCGGTGFSSLVEWQKKCKAMWNLDYIGWSSADSFMVVKKDIPGQVMYGTWNSDDISGEVYCFMKNGN